MKKSHVLAALVLGSASLGLSSNVIAASQGDINAAWVSMKAAEAKLGLSKITANKEIIAKNQANLDAAKQRYAQAKIPNQSTKMDGKKKKHKKHKKHKNNQNSAA